MAGTCQWDVAIVGGGIAGLSTAVWARRLGLTCAVFEAAQTEGGQLRRIAQPIVDYPGLEPLSGSQLSLQLRRQAEAAGADLLPGAAVTSVDTANRTCRTEAGETFTARAMVLATGLSPRTLGVPGEDLPAALGLDRRPSQEPDWFRGRRVAVVGGGDRAAENALLLAPVAGHVWLIHRRETLRARLNFREALSKAEGVSVLLNSRVTAVAASGPGLILRLEGPDAPEQLPVDALCVYIGNRPNSDLLRGQVDLDAEGYVTVDRNGRSSVEGVYAVGDVSTPPEYQSLASAAGQAMVAAKHIALWLNREEP